MRIPKLLPVLGTLLLPFLSCHKSDIKSPVSLTIVHAIAQGKPILPVFGTGPVEYFSSAQTLSYGKGQLYPVPENGNSLQIFKSTDTLQALYSSEPDFSAGNIYSLFLSGDTASPQALLVQDNIPGYADSSAGVRFINLSPASGPISINIKGNTAEQAEFSPIGYEQITDFKKYMANSDVSGHKYIFEIRNKANDSLLLTYTWNYTLFRNNTLVFSGAVQSGNPASLKIFSVNNY